MAFIALLVPRLPLVWGAQPVVFVQVAKQIRRHALRRQVATVRARACRPRAQYAWLASSVLGAAATKSRARPRLRKGVCSTPLLPACWSRGDSRLQAISARLAPPHLRVCRAQLAIGVLGAVRHQ